MFDAGSMNTMGNTQSSLTSTKQRASISSILASEEYAWLNDFEDTVMVTFGILFEDFHSKCSSWFVNGVYKLNQTKERNLEEQKDYTSFKHLMTLISIYYTLLKADVNRLSKKMFPNAHTSDTELQDAIFEKLNSTIKQDAIFEKLNNKIKN